MATIAGEQMETAEGHRMEKTSPASSVWITWKNVWLNVIVLHSSWRVWDLGHHHGQIIYVAAKN